MESQNFVVNGGIKLPIGFRFHPTDEELVVHYLNRKALCLPLPASVIPEFDVLWTDPWSLPAGDSKENNYYFFSTRNGNKKRERVAGSGYWKPIGKEKPILASGTNVAVGMRKAFIFQESNCSNGTKNRWLLFQYRLVDSVMATQISDGDWFVFRVFQRKRNKRKTATAVNMPCCIDFTVEDSSVFGPPQPTSPSSIEITEVSSHGLDEEENSDSVASYCPNSCLRKL
ncbi:hypothetical protein GQ457_14G004920 [Hibiscus cannabinus]